VRDVPSKGQSTRELGWHTGRVHHFHSKLEWLFFLILEWSLLIVDIREQYPLDLDETLAIAGALGIPHPQDRKKGAPKVIETDFLITVKQPIGTDDCAVAVKYVKDLNNPRTIEKLEIERVYWSYRPLDWGVVTELDIDEVLARNLEVIHPCRDLKLLPSLTPELVTRIESILAPRIAEEKLPLSRLTQESDRRLALNEGSSLLAVFHLIASRRLRVDLTVPIEPGRTLALVKDSVSTGRRRRTAGA
jgi:hypothetical protein